MWSDVYLVQICGLTQADASFVISMLFIGTMIGAPVVEWLSDRIKRRRMLMCIGAIIAFILILFLKQLPHLSLSALLAIFLGFWFITSTTNYQLSCNCRKQSFGAHLHGGKYGFHINYDRRIYLTFIWLLNEFAGHITSFSQYQFSSKDYRLALAINMPLAFVLLLVMLV